MQARDQLQELDAPRPRQAKPWSQRPPKNGVAQHFKQYGEDKVEPSHPTSNDTLLRGTARSPSENNRSKLGTRKTNERRSSLTLTIQFVAKHSLVDSCPFEARMKVLHEIVDVETRDPKHTPLRRSRQDTGARGVPLQAPEPGQRACRSPSDNCRRCGSGRAPHPDRQRQDASAPSLVDPRDRRHAQ